MEVVGKLRKNDIKILGEGKQLKKLILKKYSLEGFAKLLELEDSTLEKYLRRNKIIVDKFKEGISKIFGKQIEHLIIPIERQFENYFIEIITEIDLYNEDRDIEVFHKLIKSAPSVYHKLLGDLLIAHYRYNLKLIREACSDLERIIKEASSNKYYEVVLLAASELGFMHLKNAKKSVKIFEKHSGITHKETIIINRLTKRALYMYHYRYGVSLNRNKQHERALLQFNNAKTYAEKNKLNKIYSGFSNCYILQGEFEEARLQLAKALECELSLDDKLIILNNCAFLYYKMGQVMRSKEYIKRVVDSMDDSIDVVKQMNYIDTFLVVGDYENKSLNLDKAINMIKDMNKINNNRHIIKIFMKGVINYCKINKYMLELEYILKTYRQTINRVTNEEFKIYLKSIYYDIFLSKGGGQI